MPYVQVRVSVPLTQEQIKKLADEALNSIHLIPGKSAPVTMAEVIPECNLYFGTTDSAPCAMVDVAENNNPDPEGLKAYSKHMCHVLNEITGIELRNIYTKHHGYPQWYAGRNFVE